MRVLDLFSGIGGFSLGLERAGMKTVAFCEIEPYPRAILAKHWPGVPCYDDVRTLTAERLRADGVGPVDLICGGFPCQDLSIAGKQAGIDGERSGLWGEIARLAGELRPRYVVVENVAALLSGDDGRWFGRVLGDLAALGYDAEWHCIPASYVGAPHRRDRVWVVAYADQGGTVGVGPERNRDDRERHAAPQIQERQDVQPRAGAASDDGADHVADALRTRLAGQRTLAGRIGAQFGDPGIAGWWQSEPDVGRVAHGVPSRVDRLAALGNAVVPQVVEIIGRAIMAAEAGWAQRE